MNQSTRKFISQLSKTARRAIAVSIITGGCLSSLGYASERIDAPNARVDSGFVDTSFEAQPKTLSNALDYWIFSDDYCGWASAEPLVRNQPTTKPTIAVSKDNVTAAELAELAENEPVDVIKDCIAKGLSQARSLGATPVSKTIAEGYLPYDLSRADQIAMRMYPITIPQFNYIGDRKSAASHQAALARGPLDCLGHGVIWSQEVLPAQTVTASSTAQQETKLSLEELSQLRCVLEKEVAVAHSKADAKRRELALALSDAMRQVASVWESASSQGGEEIESGSAGSMVATDSAGLQLLSRAGVEAETPETAIAGVAVDVAESVCCPVERTEMAAVPPQNPEYAAIGVAAASLSLPQECETAPLPMARAEAIATACDSAAAALEKWAQALRRAGDSVVRVARGTVKEGSSLR